MKRVLRSLGLLVFLLAQCAAPLLHAHVGAFAPTAGLHLHAEAGPPDGDGPSLRAQVLIPDSRAIGLPPLITAQGDAPPATAIRPIYAASPTVLPGARARALRFRSSSDWDRPPPQAPPAR